MKSSKQQEKIVATEIEFSKSHYKGRGSKDRLTLSAIIAKAIFNFFSNIVLFLTPTLPKKLFPVTRSVIFLRVSLGGRGKSSQHLKYKLYREIDICVFCLGMGVGVGVGWVYPSHHTHPNSWVFRFSKLKKNVLTPYGIYILKTGYDICESSRECVHVFNV